MRLGAVCAAALPVLLLTPRASAQGSWWRLVQEHRIGSALGEGAYAFSPAPALTAAADGTLFVLDRGRQEVRVFDDRGRYVRTLGGEGAGPGEFLGAARLGWRSDTLWVADVMQMRTTYFTRDGRVVRTEGPAFRASGGYAPAVPEAVLADGSTLVMPAPVQERMNVPAPERLPILRVGGGGRADTLAWQPLRNRMLRFPLQGRNFSLLQPWDDTPLLAVAPDGSGIVVVERRAATGARQGLYRVTRLGPRGDTTFSRQYSYAPVPVPARWRGEWINDMAGRIAAAGAGLDRRQVAASLAQALYEPAFMPPVTAVVAGRDGSVWLRREQRGSGVTWHVLDTRGGVEASVQVPADLQVLEARRTNLWGVMYDEMDVPYIHRYRLLRARAR